MPPIINKEVCDGCGVCVAVCPEDVFFGTKRKAVPVVTYPEECWHCGSCTLDCPRQGAIRLRVPLPSMIGYSPDPIRRQDVTEKSGIPLRGR